MGGRILELHTEKMIKKGKREERKDGIRSLIATVKELSASPAQAVEQLMKRYSLTEAEAQAAVQANW